jgi:hypothetical protein
MYFPQNWDFGSALLKLWNFGGGGLNPPNHSPPLSTPLTGNKNKKNTVKLLLALLSSKIQYSLNINGKMRLHLEKGEMV